MEGACVAEQKGNQEPALFLRQSRSELLAVRSGARCLT